jgi:hypothetical protein
MVYMCSGVRTAGAFEKSLHTPRTTNRKHLWPSCLAKALCQVCVSTGGHAKAAGNMAGSLQTCKPCAACSERLRQDSVGGAESMHRCLSCAAAWLQVLQAHAWWGRGWPCLVCVLDIDGAIAASAIAAGRCRCGWQCWQVRRGEALGGLLGAT